jgi:hypothetical protein
MTLAPYTARDQDALAAATFRNAWTVQHFEPLPGKRSS